MITVKIKLTVVTNIQSNQYGNNNKKQNNHQSKCFGDKKNENSNYDSDN